MPNSVLLAKANEGDIQSMLQVAAEYYRDHDLEKAIEYFKMAVRYGSAQAIGFLKQLYSEELDHKNGNWLQTFLEFECSHNNRVAISSLAYMYMQGQYVEKNESKALSLLYKGADLNDGYCINFLAGSYFDGKLGLTPDTDMAIMYLNMGRKIGYAPSIAFLAHCYATGDGVTEDSHTAFELYTEAAEKDFAEAQYELFLIYKDGNGVEANYDKAIYWLQRAAQNGHRTAKRIIEG